MQGVVAEADLRLAETKKLGYEFDRDIIRGAVNPVSSAVFLCLSVLVNFGVAISLSLSISFACSVLGSFWGRRWLDSLRTD